MIKSFCRRSDGSTLCHESERTGGTPNDGLRTSHDLEDIVFVLNNRSEVYEEIRNTENKVRTYLSNSFLELLSMDSIDEAIAAVLDYGEPLGTQRRIRETMERIKCLKKEGTSN